MKWMAGVQQRLIERKGSAIIEVLISAVLLTFFLFYPIFTFSYTQKINRVEDVLTLGLQMVATNGGLNEHVAETIYRNFEMKGLLPSGDTSARDSVILKSNADFRVGQSGSPIYRDDADPIISLQIMYPANKEVRFINALSKMIGAGLTELPFEDLDGNVDYYYVASGVIMSEKVDY